MNKYLYSLGLMSGTSVDGIDVSIIKSDGEEFVEVIDDLYQKYDSKFISKIKKIIDLCSSKDHFSKLSKDIKEIEKEITLLHVNACRTIKKRNKDIKIDLIGFHGQTVIHKPQKGYSIQIGNSKLLSKLTNTTVVSNFRENDILNGGQGAPLAPLYHKLILKKTKLDLPLAIVNIGGISNITYIGNKNKIISFDTGPGNYLIDKLVKTKSKLEFDKGGLLAKSGLSNDSILEKFLNNSYFKKRFPKSLDIKDLNFYELDQLNLEDGCATLSMLTVKSICSAINSFDIHPKAIFFSGGGRKNEFIIDNIKKITKKPVYLIDQFKFNGDFIESQAFAYLAIRSYLKKYITFPDTTGVRKPCLGGSITEN